MADPVHEQRVSRELEASVVPLYTMSAEGISWRTRGDFGFEMPDYPDIERRIGRCEAPADSKTPSKNAGRDDILC
jgi:hypothetical protein